MSPEEREKAIQIMVERHMSRVTYGSKAKGIAYANMAYKRYSDENLLILILNPEEN